MAGNVIIWNPEQNNLPDDMLVDTSIALAISVKTHENNEQASKFLRFCHQKDKTLYFSGVHEAELRHQLALAYSKEVGLALCSIDYDKENRYRKRYGYKLFYQDLQARGVNFNVSITPKVEGAIADIKALTQFIPANLDENTFKQASILREKVPYHVEVNDLLAVVTAHEYGINSEVSTDGGLRDINNFNLIKLKPSARQHRGPSKIIPFTEGCIYL